MLIGWLVGACWRGTSSLLWEQLNESRRGTLRISFACFPRTSPRCWTTLHLPRQERYFHPETSRPPPTLRHDVSSESRNYHACCAQWTPPRRLPPSTAARTRPRWSPPCSSACCSSRIQSRRRAATTPPRPLPRLTPRRRAYQASGGPICWCQVSEHGINFTVNEAKSLQVRERRRSPLPRHVTPPTLRRPQASAYMKRGLFHEWQLVRDAPSCSRGAARLVDCASCACSVGGGALLHQRGARAAPVWSQPLDARRVPAHPRRGRLRRHAPLAGALSLLGR